jgi:heat shock protein HslJ
MARPWWSGAVLAAALTAQGCASLGGGGFVPPNLAGSSWVAESVDGQGTVGRPPVTLTFESGERAVGSTGCNSYFAAVRMSGRASLRFGQAGSTRMACPPAVMEQEQRFLSALEAVRSYRLDGTTLVLLDERGISRMRLIRAPRGAATGRPGPSGS